MALDASMSSSRLVQCQYDVLDPSGRNFTPNFVCLGIKVLSSLILFSPADRPNKAVYCLLFAFYSLWLMLVAE